MKNRYVKIGLIVLAILFAVYLIFNFGINYWLKQNLPSYIKNNSDYTVTYKSLDVDVATGNIFSTGVTVNNKNPQNQNVIGLQGTIDTLKVSRLALYDALFKKRINTSDLQLVHPNLNIVLAKPVDDRTGKKRNPVVIENIRINKGNITIFRHTKQKYFSVQDMDLSVENLQMTEEQVEKKLPVVFDKYDIRGKHFYFRPDNIYALTAQYVTTENGQMSIKDFALKPLLTPQQFTRYFPKKRNLFHFTSSELEFKDILLKDNRIALSNVRFEKPYLKMHTTNAPAKKNDKSFAYDVNLEQVLLNDAKIEILKTNGNPVFSGENLTLNISKLAMDEESATGTIPFGYEKFRIDGRNLNYYTANENISTAAVAINEKTADLRNISVKSLSANPQKSFVDLSVNKIQLLTKDWALIKGKLKMEGENLLIDGLNGSLKLVKKSGDSKSGFGGIEYPLTLKNANIRNSNLILEQGGKPIELKDLNARISSIEMNAETVKDGIPFKTGNYNLTTRNFSYQTEYYNLKAGLLKLNKNSAEISSFALKPRYSRAQFIRMIPTEKDLYDITTSKITLNGTWDLAAQNKFIDASQITLDGVDAQIFRSKIPKDDTSTKPMYSELLRSVKFPLFIKNLDIKNSILTYEEDTKKSDGPGKLTFANFNLNAKNINSAKYKGRATHIPIQINCSFMKTSPMKVNWDFDTANMNDAFTIKGNISSLPAANINPFIEPYLKVRATGNIENLAFDFKGNKNGLGGLLKMKHKDLKVALLKETGEKNKLLSGIVNIFVKSNSAQYPESVSVEGVERDKTKSFFNMFWKGVEEGLKKTLIGTNVENTEKSVKKTVDVTKKSVNQIGEDFKSAKDDVKSAVQRKDKPQEEQKEGFFQRLFKKKEKSGEN